MRSELNPNLEHELRHDAELELAIVAAAEEARQMTITFARGVSRGPWMMKGGRTWEQAITVERDAGGVNLVNNDSGGHLYEWGSRNTPPHAILRRAVRAVGMLLRESQKP